MEDKQEVNQPVENETVTETEVPEYVKHEKEDIRSNISAKLGFQDHERQIFEILCRVALESTREDRNLIFYEDAWKKVGEHGRNYLIREIYSDVNAQIQTQSVIKKLHEAGYCKIERGTPGSPVSFILLAPESEDDKDASLEKQEHAVRDMYVEIIEKLLEETKDGNRPFPTNEKVEEIIRRENFTVKLNNLNIEKYFTKIDSTEFNEKFLQT